MSLPMLPQLARHARPVLRKPPQGPPKRGDLARSGGTTSLPALLRAPAAFHAVHVYEHTHDHHHVVYRSQSSVAQQDQFGDEPGFGSGIGYGGYSSSAPLLAHMQEDKSWSNAERLLSTVDPTFQISHAGDWDNCRGGSTGLWVAPDESVSSRGGSPIGDLRPLQPPPMEQQPATSSNFPAAAASSGMHPQHADTATNWTKYQSAKERSSETLSRRPAWCRGANIENEGVLDKMNSEMDQQEQWPHHRAFIQRQFRGLPDSKESDMKRKLVGDPRMHDKRDKQYIHKLKKEEIERDREKARRIQGVMQQCSKSRHQLVRMQNQLRNAEGEERGTTRAESRGHYTT